MIVKVVVPDAIHRKHEPRDIDEDLQGAVLLGGVGRVSLHPDRAGKVVVRRVRYQIVDQRGGAEKVEGHGGEPNNLARPDRLGEDMALDSALDPMGDVGKLLVRCVLVRGRSVDDPVLDCVGLAKAVP